VRLAQFAIGARVSGGDILDVFLLVFVCNFNIPTAGLEVYSLPFAKDFVFDREMLEYHIINVVVTVSKSAAFPNIETKRDGRTYSIQVNVR